MKKILLILTVFFSMFFVSNNARSNQVINKHYDYTDEGISRWLGWVNEKTYHKFSSLAIPLLNRDGKVPKTKNIYKGLEDKQTFFIHGSKISQEDSNSKAIRKCQKKFKKQYPNNICVIAIETNNVVWDLDKRQYNKWLDDVQSAYEKEKIAKAKHLEEEKRKKAEKEIAKAKREEERKRPDVKDHPLRSEDENGNLIFDYKIILGQFMKPKSPDINKVPLGPYKQFIKEEEKTFINGERPKFFAHALPLVMLHFKKDTSWGFGEENATHRVAKLVLYYSRQQSESGFGASPYSQTAANEKALNNCRLMKGGEIWHSIINCIAVTAGDTEVWKENYDNFLATIDPGTYMDQEKIQIAEKEREIKKEDKPEVKEEPKVAKKKEEEEIARVKREEKEKTTEAKLKKKERKQKILEKFRIKKEKVVVLESEKDYFDTCKRYGFKVGTTKFGECVLKVREFALEQEKINAAKREEINAKYQKEEQAKKGQYEKQQREISERQKQQRRVNLEIQQQQERERLAHQRKMQEIQRKQAQRQREVYEIEQMQRGLEGMLRGLCLAGGC